MPLEFIALFAPWSGRAVAPLSPRTWPAVAAELERGGSRSAVCYRLRTRGLAEAAALLEDDELAAGAERLVAHRAAAGWRPITPCCACFPPRLRSALWASCPPVLWVKGETEGLRSPGAGIVGSRSLSASEAHFAGAAGRKLADLGLSVLSGGAEGADALGVAEAAEAGGCGAHFLPGGEPDIPPAASALISRNPSAAPFDRLDALRRNRWVYAASRAVVIVASRFGEGGSWAGAITAKRTRLTSLLVFMGDPPSSGNLALSRLGAFPVRSAGELESALRCAAPEPLRLAI